MNESPFLIQNNFQGKIVLITGGTGSIGSEIVKQIIPYRPQQIRIFSRDETKQLQLQQDIGSLSNFVDIRYLIGDIRDKDRLDVALNRVNIIFHAAALKHVPFCEYNPFEAIKTNVYGTQNIIDLSIRHNVEKLIAISTDKAVNPNTMMGITKLMMERMVVSSKSYIGKANTMMSVVRFGNVLNSRGSVIPTWINQINKGGPVTVTNRDMRRYFMTIADAVDLVINTSMIMRGQETFILKMNEINIYDLAKQIINEHSKGQKIDIVFTGAREREKNIESLYTNEEAKNMIDAGKYYIILPTVELFEERKKFYYPIEHKKNINEIELKTESDTLYSVAE